MTINTEKLDPRKWSKRNKIIAAAIVAILVLASIAAGVLHSQFQHDKDAKNCVAYQEVVANNLKSRATDAVSAMQGCSRCTGYGRCLPEARRGHPTGAHRRLPSVHGGPERNPRS